VQVYFGRGECLSTHGAKLGRDSKDLFQASIHFGYICLLNTTDGQNCEHSCKASMSDTVGKKRAPAASMMASDTETHEDDVPSASLDIKDTHIKRSKHDRKM